MGSPDPPEKAGRGRVEKPVTDRQYLLKVTTANFRESNGKQPKEKLP